MQFMLLQNHAPAKGEPMSRWTAEEINEHIAFQRALNEDLRDRGELVDARGLAGPAAAKIVTASDQGPPVVTDGPFAEFKEFLAGYRVIDVESLDRAIEIAAAVSAAPGLGGRPIRQPIEIREVMR
jgi:hypothetical protein